MRFARYWLALCGSGLLAATAGASEPELELQPSVCALSDDQPLCRQLVRIRWHADDPLALCLFVDRMNDPLNCWQDRLQGQHLYPVRSDRSLTFMLRRRDDDRLLTSERFEIVREVTEYRSRRRRPWHFF